MEPENLSTLLKQPDIEPCSEAAASSPHAHILFLSCRFEYYLPFRLSLQADFCFK